MKPLQLKEQTNWKCFRCDKCGWVRHFDWIDINLIGCNNCGKLFEIIPVNREK